MLKLVMESSSITPNMDIVWRIHENGMRSVHCCRCNNCLRFVPKNTGWGCKFCGADFSGIGLNKPSEYEVISKYLDVINLLGNGAELYGNN